MEDLLQDLLRLPTNFISVRGVTWAYPEAIRDPRQRMEDLLQDLLRLPTNFISVRGVTWAYPEAMLHRNYVWMKITSYHASKTSALLENASFLLYFSNHLDRPPELAYLCIPYTHHAR